MSCFGKHKRDHPEMEKMNFELKILLASNFLKQVERIALHNLCRPEHCRLLNKVEVYKIKLVIIKSKKVAKIPWTPPPPFLRPDVLNGCSLFAQSADFKFLFKFLEQIFDNLRLEIWIQCK